MNEPTAPQDLRSSVEALLKPTAQHWLIAMFKHIDYKVITPLDPDKYATHKEFQHLSPQPRYYVFHNRLDLERPENSVPVLLDTKNALCKAIVTYNTCFDACFVLWRFSYEVLKEHFQDSSLEWCRSFVRPKIVLFPAHTIEEGHEILHLHDFFRVTLKTGEVFAVDLSAWQFGFRSWFYTWSEYVEECIGIENVFGMTVLSAKTEMMRVLGKSVGGRTEHDQHLIDLQLRFYEMDGEKLKQWRESVEPVEF